ncbi:unnamed protein product [Ilex paraguariensis]|uniref:Uncharacterized protein n=1 Tax=Ilex paraguariensis TaxID=185542 RepID=A0ABC8T1R4_9AQUA
MAMCRRVVQLGTKLRGFNVARVSAAVNMLELDSYSVKLYGSLSSHSNIGRFNHRQMSQLVPSNGNRVFLVDTLALVRSLEAQGVPSKQAEAITAAITEVLNDSLENVSHSFVSKAEMQKTQMIHESNLGKFKSEVKSSQFWLVNYVLCRNLVNPSPHGCHMDDDWAWENPLRFLVGPTGVLETPGAMEF